MTPRMRWVAPPNWPSLPEGFEPPQGWTPDPSWPAPPVGWQFWQTGVVDVNSGLPWRRRLSQRRLGTILGLGFVAVVILAAIGIPWHHHRSQKFDSTRLDQQIQRDYARRGVPGAVVHCPSGKPVKAGTSFLCGLSGTGPFRFVKVDVLNNAGQITFEAIQ